MTSGGFGRIMYKPNCYALRRELEYTTYASGNNLVAQVVDAIPDECPLTEFKGEKINENFNRL